MNRLEALVFALVFALAGSIWLAVGRVEVSPDTSTRYVQEGPSRHHWHDGMGSQITLSHVSPQAPVGNPAWGKWTEKSDEFTIFWLKLEEKPGPNFLMVDLPYSHMLLRDDQGREYRLLNPKLAGSNPDLEAELTVFDWTLFNNAFPDGPTRESNAVQQGPLLFEPVAPDSRNLRLEMKYCMVGKPPWQLRFEFETTSD